MAYTYTGSTTYTGGGGGGTYGTTTYYAPYVPKGGPSRVWFHLVIDEGILEPGEVVTLRGDLEALGSDGPGLHMVQAGDEPRLWELEVELPIGEYVSDPCECLASFSLSLSLSVLVSVCISIPARWAQLSVLTPTIRVIRYGRDALSRAVRLSLRDRAGRRLRVRDTPTHVRSAPTDYQIGRAHV